MVAVTIVGAGIAGCGLGHLLTEHGHDVTLVEKDAIGGMLRDIEFESGAHCDSAPHILFFDDEDSTARELITSFTGIREIDPYAKTYPRGDLDDPHNYPVSKDVAANWDDADAIRDEVANASPDASGETFDEFVKGQVGARLYERYFEEYTRKQWGVDPERIVGDWFDYKISFPESEQPFFGDADAFYPERRYVDVLEEMASDCSVVYEAATGLQTDGDTICSLELASGDRLDGDVFVNTIDPTFILDTDERLNYRSMVITAVTVDVDSDAIFPEHVDWGYFPNDYEFTRLTDYDFTRRNDADECVLTFEFPCYRGDDLWTRDEAWHTEYVESFLGDQDLDASVREVVLRRLPAAYPLPVRAEMDRFERVNDQLSEFENMYNLGRVGTYQYIWIKDILNQAAEVAEAVNRDLATSP